MSTGIGETLQDAREQQGRTVEDVARSLRLRAEQVRALEEERFGGFGGDVYARGFLKSYAVELGLDPAPLLDTYRREVTGEDPLSVTPLVEPGAAGPVRERRGAPPAWLAWVVGAIVVIGVLAGIGQIAGGRAPEVASPEPPPPPVEDVEDDGDVDAGTDDGDGTDTGSETGADDGDDATEPEPEPEPEPTFEGIELLLALEEDSWMRVTIDGSVVFEQVADQGQTLAFSGDDNVVVRYGNAGGVRVEFNGEDLGTPGQRGEVAELEYTPDGETEA